MDKRLLLAVVVSMAILFLWWKIFPPTPQHVQGPTPITSPSAPVHEVGKAVPTSEQAAASDKTPAAAASRQAEALITLDAPDASYVFSSWGASLRQIRLKDRQFLLRRDQPDSGMQIVSTSKEDTAPLRTSFAKADFAWNDSIAWSVTRPAVRRAAQGVCLTNLSAWWPTPGRGPPNPRPATSSWRPPVEPA